MFLRGFIIPNHFFACHKKPSQFLQVIYKNQVNFYASFNYKNRVSFYVCYKQPSRFLQLTHQKRHNFETNAHQVNVLVFAKNRPIKIGIMILKQMAHHNLSLLQFLPLTYHHSHFLVATFDFTSFFTLAFLEATPFFYNLAVFD